MSLVGPPEMGKSPLIYNHPKTGTFQPEIDKIHFLNQHSQVLYDVMQKDIDNLEFVQVRNFECIDSLENNGTKYLLFFEDSCQEICKSKGSADIVTAVRHRGLSTILH